MRARWSRRIALGSAVLGTAVIGLGLLSGDEFLSWWRVQQLLSRRVFESGIQVDSASPIDPRAQLLSVGSSGETYWNGERVELEVAGASLVYDPETGLCTAPILLEIEDGTLFGAFWPVLEWLIVRHRCVNLGMLGSTPRGHGCVWLDVPIARSSPVTRFTRGGPRLEEVVLNGEVTLIPVSIESDGDILIEVARARSAGEIRPIGAPTDPEPSPPVRLAYSEWKRLGVVRAASEQTSDLSWSRRDSSFVFSVQFDPAVALGHIVEFISVVRSTLGDRGYVEFEAREVEY